MEENKEKKENCCCGDSHNVDNSKKNVCCEPNNVADNSGKNACCEPPKFKCLYKIIFLAVILAVAGILIYKFCFKPAPVENTVTSCCPSDSINKCSQDTTNKCATMTHSCSKKNY